VHGGAFHAADRGARQLSEPGFGLALGLIELEGAAQEFVGLLSVTGPEARRPGVGSPTKSQEGTPPDALEVRSVAYGKAFPFALA
jgi:hypothetical protein